MDIQTALQTVASGWKATVDWKAPMERNDSEASRTDTDEVQKKIYWKGNSYVWLIILFSDVLSVLMKSTFLDNSKKTRTDHDPCYYGIMELSWPQMENECPKKHKADKYVNITCMKQSPRFFSL